MFKKLKLGAKLNLLLGLILLTTMVTSGLVLSYILSRNAQSTITDQALLLIETMSSVRQYTTEKVNPELAPRLETETYFLPQTIPAYSAREVFENLRTRPEYNSFFYKEATLNPTNLRDKADPFETELVNQFRDNSNIQQLTGFRRVPGGDLFYIARPLKVNQASCLKCHSVPEEAPRSQIATYGSDNGFGWKLNEIVASQIISVPASTVFATARKLQILVIGIISLFFVLAIVLINLFLKYTVTKPLQQMSKLAQKISTGDMEGEFKHPNQDEIGILAASLNRLKISLQMAMNMLSSNENT
jgi:HAMP domain-containing protein